MNNSNLKSANILIVDDKQANIDLLTGFLEDEGYANYTSTTDSREVTKLFKEFKPDLILLDLQMPHLTGFQVMEQLKGLIPEDDYLPILVLTADVTTETKLEALASGAKDFLSKPFDLTEVELRIKHLLLTRSMNIQLKDQNLILEEKVKERTLKLENNIVELSAAKEKAEESNRLKTAFLNNLSHEVRTPMNGILGFTDILRDPALTSEEKEEYIENLHLSSQRMLNTVEDIVVISEIQAGDVTIEWKETDINKSLKELVETYKPEAEEKELVFKLDQILPENQSAIFTDKDKFETILTNLIKNAIKYTEEGRINVGANIKNDWVEFYVKDTGIGIPKNRQEAIFHRFEQADISDSRAFEGSGLGLAISKAYVEMLGGEIWLESEDNKGAVFYFTLPVKKVKEHKQGEQPKEAN